MSSGCVCVERRVCFLKGCRAPAVRAPLMGMPRGTPRWPPPGGRGWAGLRATPVASGYKGLVGGEGGQRWCLEGGRPLLLLLSLLEGDVAAPPLTRLISGGGKWPMLRARVLVTCRGEGIKGGGEAGWDGCCLLLYDLEGTVWPRKGGGCLPSLPFFFKEKKRKKSCSVQSAVWWRHVLN